MTQTLLSTLVLWELFSVKALPTCSALETQRTGRNGLIMCRTVAHLLDTEVADLSRGIHSLYVYSDVIEPCPVGDTRVPLLRIVPLEEISEVLRLQYSVHSHFLVYITIR